LRFRRGLPDDALLIPYISSAINAYGAHVENNSAMQQTIQIAISKLTFGAHLGERFPKSLPQVVLTASDTGSAPLRQSGLLQSIHLDRESPANQLQLISLNAPIRQNGLHG